MSRVPVMNAGADDAARRFITMVDEFYDRGVKLILSAGADSPGGLYVENGSFSSSAARRAGCTRCKGANTSRGRIGPDGSALVVLRFRPRLPHPVNRDDSMGHRIT